MRKLLETPNDFALTFARLALGIMMFPHGAQKMLGWFGGQGFEATMSGMSQKFPPALVFLAIIAEFFGAIGLIVGGLSRIAAFGVGVVMVIAGLQHLPNGFFMNWMGSNAGEGWEFHLLAVGLSLAVMIRGAGALSFDRWFSKLLATREEKSHAGHAQPV